MYWDLLRFTYIYWYLLRLTSIYLIYLLIYNTFYSAKAFTTIPLSYTFLFFFFFSLLLTDCSNKRSLRYCSRLKRRKLNLKDVKIQHLPRNSCFKGSAIKEFWTRNRSWSWILTSFKFNFRHFCFASLKFTH